MTRTLDEVRQLDADDPLREFRDRFLIPADIIYLDGNSLGALPRATVEKQRKLVEQEWGRDLIRGWNTHGWIGMPQKVGARIAGLIGAREDEVIVADSTSINLFKLIVAASALTPHLRQILTETGNFPTDLYITRGAAKLTGFSLEEVEPDAVDGALGADTNLLVLTHVHYKTACRRDMAAVTARAKAAGARTIWDLSHSVGAVPLDLNRDGVELAVGCGYKYLNGGPGAPAFLYVARDLQDSLRSPLCGWMGHDKAFDFTDAYEPAGGIKRFLAGTPPILGLAALECGVATFDGAGMDRVWRKSVALFDLFRDLVEEYCPTLECVSPREPERRGSHISFRNTDPGFEPSDTVRLSRALIANGVIGDARPPVVRFGLTPLYLRFEDVWWAVDRMRAILDSEQWREDRFAEPEEVI